MADNNNLPQPPLPPEPPHKSPQDEVVGGASTPEPLIDDSGVDFGGIASARDGASGIIPLEELPEPSSSPSLISWTEVIRQHREAAQNAPAQPQEVKIDAGSDKDLLDRIIAEEQQAAGVTPAAPASSPSSEPMILEAEEAIPLDLADEVSGSAIQFASADVPFPHEVVSGSEVQYDVHNPPSDAAGVIAVPEFLYEETSEVPVDPDDIPMADTIPLAEAIPPEVHAEELELPPSPTAAADEGMIFAVTAGEDADASSVSFAPPMPPPEEMSQHSSILEILLGDTDEQGEPLPSPRSDVVDLVGGRHSTIMQPGYQTQQREPKSTYPELPIPETPAAQASDSQGSGTIEPVMPGMDWLSAPDAPDQIATPSASDVVDPVTADDSVDLYAEAPISTGISDSGSLQVNQEQLEAAERRARMIESSAVDLSSVNSLGSVFDIEMQPTIPADEGPAQDDLNIDAEAIDAVSYADDDFPTAQEVTAEEAEAADLLSAAQAEVDAPPGMTTWQADALNPDLQTVVHQPLDQGIEVAEEVTLDDTTQLAIAASQATARAGRDAGNRTRNRASISEDSDADRNTPVNPGSANSEPKKGKKNKGSGVAVGALVGLVIGAAGFGAAWYGGALPANPETLFDGEAKNKDGAPPLEMPPGGFPGGPPGLPGGDNNPPGIPQGMAFSPELANSLLESGDLKKAIGVFDQLTPSVVVHAGRGKAKWLQHVQIAADDNRVIKRDDPAVTEALKDLDAAIKLFEQDPKPEHEKAAATAALWKGLIEESLGNLAEARQIYSSSVAHYGSFSAAFATALKRLNLLAAPKNQMSRALDSRDALIAFTILLQAKEPDAKASLDTSEAGFRFWDAMVEAKNQSYGEAIKLLAEAKAIHAKQRAKSPGKGLNPLSDPREQIFDRCCDGLTQYWTLLDKLYQNPAVQQLVKDKGPDEAIASLITARQDAETALKNIVDKLMLKKDQKPEEAIVALVKAKEDAETAKKTAEAMLAKLGTILKDAGFDDPKVDEGIKKVVAVKVDAETKLKAAVDALDKAGVKEPDLGKAIAMIASSRDELDAVVKGLKQKLIEAKYLDPSASTKEALLKGVDEAVTRGSSDAVKLIAMQKAEVEKQLDKAKTELAEAMKIAKAAMNQAADEIAKQKKRSDEAVAAAKKEAYDARMKAKDDLIAQQKRFEAMLAAARTPAQVIDIWLPALADLSGTVNPANALVDADAILKDDQASPELKAKALAVKALALRNQNKIPESLEAFGAFRNHAGVKEQPWAKLVFAAEEKLRNPTVIDTPAPLTLQQVLRLLDAKLKQTPMESNPKEASHLLAQRSRVKLEMEDIEGAAADASAAVQAESNPDALLSAAQVAEKQRKWDDADRLYREVMKLEKPGSVLRRLAQQGLARVLLKRSSPPEAAPPAATSDENAPKASPGSVSQAPIKPQVLLAMLTMFVASGDVPVEVAEALRLADELIAQKDYIGHIIKADALAKTPNRYKEALQEYALGIKRLKALPKEYEGVLDRILDSNPLLKEIDPASTLESPTGQKYYSAGIDAFNTGHFSQAEQYFVRAVQLNNKDARYLYFLGASRWMQGKKGVAEDDFRAASLLELRGQPATRFISDSLETVQGPVRLALERFRP